MPGRLSNTLGFVIDNPIERRRVGFSRAKDGLLADVIFASDRGILFQRVHVRGSGNPTTVEYQLTSMNPGTILPAGVAASGASLFEWATSLLAGQFPSESVCRVGAYRVFPNGVHKDLFKRPLVAGAELDASPLMTHIDKALAGRWTLGLCFFLRPEGELGWAQTLTVSKSRLSLSLSNPHRDQLWALRSSAAGHFEALKNDIEAGYPASPNMN